eukprot:scaffold23027_cov36-Phaeocystis_antarctica.AAC.1
MQQQPEVTKGVERARMPIAEGLTPPLQRLAKQRLSGSEVALFVQQRAEVGDGAERSWVPIAEGLTQPIQCLAAQRRSGGEVALFLQQQRIAVLVHAVGCVLPFARACHLRRRRGPSARARVFCCKQRRNPSHHHSVACGCVGC